jgi:hypothetical protein
MVENITCTLNDLSVTQLYFELGLRRTEEVPKHLRVTSFVETCVIGEFMKQYLPELRLRVSLLLTRCRQFKDRRKQVMSSMYAITYAGYSDNIASLSIRVNPPCRDARH